MKTLTNLTSVNNNKILVVLPINKVEDVFLNECTYSISQSKYPLDVLVLTNGLSASEGDAVNSILAQPTVVHLVNDTTGGTKQDIVVSDKKINYTIVETNSTTFPMIFNEAFNYANDNNYQYFSIIEPDDLIDNSWYSNVDAYSTEKPEFSGYMPLVREISNGSFVGFFNEASWFDGLAEVAGVFDIQILLKYNCMNITGAAFKTAALKEYSVSTDGYYKPMKESMKVSYVYEFFLRMIYNDLKFHTIARVGYEHRIDRACDTVNNFISKIPKDIMAKPLDKGGMTQEEYRFWSDLAKKEYFFDEDRNIAFKELSVA